MRAITTPLIPLAVLAGQASAFFRLPCSRPVVVQRADPIVNPGEVATHVHTIMGGNGFNFTMDYDDAMASTCSTCKVRQDLSNYWIPNLYYQAEDGTFESVKQSGGMLAYYLQRSDSEDPEYDNGLLAFPEGFQMLAGDPDLRSFDEDSLEQRAISYACLGVSGPETNAFPEQNCPNGLRAQVMFPSCWDGENLDSSDHRSHMAYPSGVDSGSCPESHPKRFITLFYEVVFQVDEFKDKWYGDSQPFIFSNGDPTGFGLHGDFVNGWDIDVLQEAVDECTDDSGVIERCPVFDFFEDDDMNSCQLPARVNETITGTLDALPGCNPVQDGPGDAEPHSDDCGALTEIGEPQWPFEDATESHSFKYLGCANYPRGDRPLDGTSTSGDDMTVESCLEYCEEEGFEFAGLEYARECHCGNSVSQDRMPVQGRVGGCEMECSGDETQLCGGGAALSLYQKCEGGEACENAELI